jgi:hypothetical protein
LQGHHDVPIQRHDFDDYELLLTQLIGVVTEAEFLSYYGRLLETGRIADFSCELVDGRHVTRWDVPPEAQWTLADMARERVHLLSDLSVAMLAPNDLLYGVFRMWQLQRADLDYEVQAFRELADAVEWLGVPPELFRP